MSSEKTISAIGVLTSGGDAPGMNPALRAVVRAALDRGVEVYAIYEGYRGMVNGSEFIKKMNWESVGGIIHQGGTIIGSARCPEFMERAGRLQAAKHLLEVGIDNLIVIGGDGSLTGANIFREEWSSLLAELVQQGEITQALADKHPYLRIVGLVGSIDNDMFGTDMTIGTDTALHRIVEAVDAISSTASSHQRAFVIEVMGRHCGYLALMAAIATGANWVFIPECPPESDNWEEDMCAMLSSGRRRGRRASIVIVAEGATDKQGKPITSNYIKQTLEERIGEDTRVTVLGHVQRGGSPTGFERYMSTIVGYAAVQQLLDEPEDSESQLVGIRQNRVIHTPLMECVAKTHHVAELVKAQDFEAAMEMRGRSFVEVYGILQVLARAKPQKLDPEKRQLRLAVMHAGGPAPGMNTAVRVAARLGLNQGHTLLGVVNGFKGLMEGKFRQLEWMDITGWVAMGGAELGTSRYIPKGQDFYKIAQHIQTQNIDGILIIGGWSGYQAAYAMHQQRANYPPLNIPIICLPASINNNLPGSEHSVGTDTALNNIILNVDKIKQSAVATQRCFVVEVMGHDCGYLALMSGMATGAERVYLPEEGVTLADLQVDVAKLIEGFTHGKRVGLMIRNERVDALYTTNFMQALFEKEGGDLFDVRTAILGHIQQGGNPTPYDRIQATRLAARCIDFLQTEAESDQPKIAFIGFEGGKLNITNIEQLPSMLEKGAERPIEQWWRGLRGIAAIMAQPKPSGM